MDTTVYDVTIGEVASMLDKSDRQVRRYVKAKRLRAKPVRIGGHIKLMFNKDQVVGFKETLETLEQPEPEQIVVDARLVDGQKAETEEAVEAEKEYQGEEKAVKYVIDALKEQIDGLRNENKDLHYQLEQRSGQVGFLQGKIETLEEEIKMLAPVPKQEEPRKSLWQRLFGKQE